MGSDDSFDQAVDRTHGLSKVGWIRQKVRMNILLFRRLGPLALVGASAAMIGCSEANQGRLTNSSISATTGIPVLAIEPRPPGATPPPPSSTAAVPVVVAQPSTGNLSTVPTSFQPVPAVLETVPEKLRGIVKLADAKVSSEVVLALINRDERDYALNADEILLLRRRGLDEGVIAAMIRRPVESASARVEQQIATGPTTTQAVASPAPLAPQAVASQPVQTIVSVPTQTVVVQQPAQVVTVQYFQESLSPYGSWIQIDGAGLCWQPTIVVSDPLWRPYYNGGRWVYSSSGWYWQSDYNWGWAAFHYGRWSRHHRHGWVWSPDTVWAPAWVSWRQSQDYFGWAPLPPGSHYRSGFGFTYQDRNVGISFGFGLGYDDFCFVPARRFCDPNPWRHGIGPHERQIVYNQTTVINNYVSGDNNVIINEGIGRTRIASATGQKLEPVPIRQIPAREHNGSRADTFVDGGRSIAVYRPAQVENAPRNIAPASGRSTMPSGVAGSSRDYSGGAPSGRSTGGSDLRSSPITGRPGASQPILPSQPALPPQPMLPRERSGRSDVRAETPALTVPRLVESPTIPRQAVQLPPVSMIRQQPRPAVATPPTVQENARIDRMDFSPRSGRTEALAQRETRQQQSPAMTPAPVVRTETPLPRYERPSTPNIPSGREQYAPTPRQQPVQERRYESTAPLARAAAVQQQQAYQAPPTAPMIRQIGATPPTPAPAPQASPDRGQRDQATGRSGRDRGN